MGGFAATPMAGVLNVAATNIAKDYANNELVGDQIAPRVPMDRQAFQYVVHDYLSLRLDGSTLRAPGAAPRTIRSSFSTDTYFCDSHAEMAEIPVETEAWGTGFGFSQISRAGVGIMNRLLLDREVAVAKAVQGAGTTLALSSGACWDQTTSTPIENIYAAREIARQSGVEANILVLGSPVVTALMSNLEIVDRLKYTNTSGMIDLNKLSSVFGVKCVRGAAILYDKNNVPSFVWGQTATLAYVKEVSDQADISSAKTFVWTGAPNTMGGYGVITEPKYPLAAKATLVSADWYWDVKVTAPETLATFTNCCAAPTYITPTAPATGF
jgi:hypothetical protein